jgi:hypothetical protein
MAKLLAAFQDFFRQHSEAWMERFDYKEAGPQLLLQAFLQRIINGGGMIHREYGLGMKRTDLLLRMPLETAAEQRVVLELKVKRGSTEAMLAEALPQTWQYMDKSGADEGHILIFDRSADRSWEQKIFHDVQTFEGRSIDVWGM